MIRKNVPVKEQGKYLDEINKAKKLKNEKDARNSITKTLIGMFLAHKLVQGLGAANAAKTITEAPTEESEVP